jgi:hypothetical protein
VTDLSGLGTIGACSRLGISGDNLILTADTGELVLLTGTPLSAPAWSSDTITSSLYDGRTMEWAIESGKVVVYATSAESVTPQRINRWIRNAVGNWSAVESVWDFADDPPTGFTYLQQIDSLTVLDLGAAAFALMADAGSIMLGTPGFNLMI